LENYISQINKLISDLIHYKKLLKLTKIIHNDGLLWEIDICSKIFGFNLLTALQK